MDLLLSIIVPVYNVERFIRQCIDSLLDQNLSVNEYEIILIDDGSPDCCGIICDEYAERYQNIRVFHQKNSGLGASRNKGIMEAKGDFILFVDSDDYLIPNVLRELLDQIHRQDLDILRFNYVNVDENGQIIRVNRNPKQYADYSDSVTDGIHFLLNKLGYACYACQFVINRLLAEHFYFLSGIHFEDTEWLIRILPSAKRVSSFGKVAYNYRIREGSITKSKTVSHLKKNITDQIMILSILKDKKSMHQGENWYDGMMTVLVLSILGNASKRLYKDHKVILKELNALGVFPLSSYQQNKQARRKVRLINFSPELFCHIYHYLA